MLLKPEDFMDASCFIPAGSISCQILLETLEGHCGESMRSVTEDTHSQLWALLAALSAQWVPDACPGAVRLQVIREMGVRRRMM